ncbi:MAG: hypothetical protein H7X79_13975 [Sporomusaceae bacterium]|nr:hypothetical protein [Sporomusaceae bacterium]
MFRKKTLIAVIAGLLIIAGSLLVAANAAVDQRGALSGEVVNVVALGTAVCEGDVLVQVKTLTGPVAAARATTDGVVAEVTVKVGDSIKVDDIVARIKTGK